MTVIEYVEESSGYGIALVEVESDRIVNPYIGRWNCNRDDDQLEQLEVDEKKGGRMTASMILSVIRVATKKCFGIRKAK